MHINTKGLSYTADGQLIIDTTQWITQAELAKKLGVSGNAINNRVRRATLKGDIETYYIPALGIRLIPNVSNISELGKISKKQ